MQILYKLKQYDLIIKTLKNKPIDRYVPSLNYLLLAQLESGNHVEAARLAEHWQSLYPTNPRFVDILGSIQIETGLYDAAIQTFKAYLEKYPNDRIITLKLATTYYKSLQFDEAMEIFDSISDYTGLPPHVGFQAADAYCKAGQLRKGYELAYEIRRQNYQKIDAHQEYIRVLTASPLDQQTPIQLNKVAVDSAVTIIDTLHVPQTFVIVNQPILTEEIKPGDLFSQQLLNKKIGDEFSIPSQKFTITNIVSKYTHAYQESVKQLGSRFANQGNIKVGNFRDDADPIAVIKELISLTSRQTEGAEKSAQDISPARLPLCIQAIRRGQTAVAFWYDLTSPDAVGIDSQMPGESFDWAIDQIGDQTPPILFDVTSLLALSAIGALDIVASTKKLIWVTESTVHLIRAELFALKILPKNITTIAEIETPISQQSRIQTVRAARINELEKLLEWIETNGTIVYPALSTNFNEDAHAINTIGRSHFDIRHISTNNSVLLITDDRNFRMWCSEEGAKAIPTIALLEGLERNSSISEGQLKNYSILLLKIHYLLIPVDGQALIELLIETGFTVAFPFNHATLWIAGPFSNVEMASAIVIDFLYKLYQETTLIESRKSAVQFILKRFVGGRTFGQISEFFMPKLKARFLLMPSQLREIHQFLVAMR
jgi:tetratricopeptide (TPR) repeat protein